MPSRHQHLPLAEFNEEFAETIAALPQRFPAWEIVALFYAALHYVDAALSLSNTHPGSHESRIAAFRGVAETWADYRHLHRLSLDVRYNMVAYSAAEADAIKSGPFRSVKEAALALLAQS